MYFNEIMNFIHEWFTYSLFNNVIKVAVEVELYCWLVSLKRKDSLVDPQKMSKKQQGGEVTSTSCKKERKKKKLDVSPTPSYHLSISILLQWSLSKCTP